MGWSLETSFPWLWSVALLSLSGIAAWRSRSSLSPVQWRVSLLLRLFLVLFLLLALANPLRSFQRNAGQAFLFLVDRSDSVAPVAQQRVAQFIASVAEKRKPEDRLGMVAFARQPELVEPLSTEFTVRTPRMGSPTDATDIAAALSYGLDLFPENSLKTLVLFSDGNETTGESRRLIERARGQGVQICAIPVERNVGTSRRVEKLFAPSRVSGGERFSLRALISNGSAKPATARLIIRKDGQIIKDEQGVSLQPGTTPITLDYRIDESGVHAFDLQVVYEDGTISTADPAFVAVQDKPRLLVVSPARDTGSFFARALGLRSLIVDETTMPPDRVESLLAYDGVILNDVGREELTDARVQVLQRYLQDFGGGLITIGGGTESSLEAFSGTPFESLLPVYVEPRRTLLKKRRDFLLMLIIDRSGSMIGEKMEMAKASAINAVEGLEPGDSIGIIAFDDQSYPVVDLTVLEGDKKPIIENIRRLMPGGGTDARTALVEALNIFSTRRINIRKHVILMTDGITVERQLLDFTRRLVENDVTLSTIAIGADANVPILEQMRQIGGGAFHLVTNTKDLPRIVVGDMDEKVKTADDIEDQFVPELFDPSPMTAGIQPDDIPALKGYVASSLKTSAIKPIMTNFRNKEDPILAAWQYGLGRSVVMLAGVNSIWSDQWLQWRNFGKLWEQVTRWTIRTRAPDEWVFALFQDGGRLRIRLESDVSSPIATVLKGTLRLPDQRMVNAIFAHHADGVYEAAFAVADSGMAHLVLVEEGAGVRSIWAGSVYLPGMPQTAGKSSEQDAQPPNFRLLQELTAGTNGLFDPRPTDLIADPKSTLERTSYRGSLLTLALCLFLMDTVVRRFDLSETWRRLSNHRLRRRLLSLLSRLRHNPG